MSKGYPSGPKWCTSAPNPASSYTTIIIGSPSRTTVSSSLMPIRYPPSPSAATGSRSGCASAAPIAVDSPSPTDWKAWVKQKPRSSGTDRYIDGYPMKLPESTATTRAAGSRSSSAIDNVRGSMRPRPVSSENGTSRQRAPCGGGPVR